MFPINIKPKVNFASTPVVNSIKLFVKCYRLSLCISLNTTVRPKNKTLCPIYVVPLLIYSASIIGVTLKCALRVVHGHWNSHLVCDPTIRQPGFDLPRNSGLCWTVFARNRDTAVSAEGDGDLQTLICVLVTRPTRCLTLSNPVPWQNWMATYLSYTLRMKTLFRGWPVMVNDTHTRRRRIENCAIRKLWYVLSRVSTDIANLSVRPLIHLFVCLSLSYSYNGGLIENHIMVLNYPKPRFQGQPIAWCWISPKRLKIRP